MASGSQHTAGHAREDDVSRITRPCANDGGDLSAVVNAGFYSDEHEERQEWAACPLCGTQADRLLFEVSDTMFGQPGKYRLVECGRCSMRYLNPRPTAAALARHYPGDYLCYTNFDREHWLLRWAFRMLQRGQAQRRLRQIEATTGR